MSLGQRTLLLWPVCLLSAVLALGAAPPPEPAEESSEAQTVQRLVAQLGSEKFADRESAGEQLETIGFPALKALKQATRSGDLEVRKRATRVIAAIKTGITGRAGQTLEIARQLEQVVNYQGIDDPKTKLIEATDQLGKIYNLTFDFNEKAFKDEMLPDVPNTEIIGSSILSPMKAELRSVLKKILTRVPARSGATYLIRKDSVEITTQAAVRADLGMKEDEELLPLVWKYFCEDPLAEALDTLSENSGYNVVLDPRVRGKTRDTVVTARLINVPVDTAVRIVADMAGLAVVRRDNIFYLTTPENARRMREEAPHRRIPPVWEMVGPPAPGTP
jgi:hypothetical protein